MNSQTKLVFALEHVAHLHDLIEDNEYEHYLNDAPVSYTHMTLPTIYSV